ncbi:MAG: DUF2267 domain-containing protein [Candidatus Limnocylindria bacterium]
MPAARPLPPRRKARRSRASTRRSDPRQARGLRPWSGPEARDRVPPANEEISMDELIQKVQQRANIDEDQASTAVNTVVDFLKERLPEPLASQIEGALSGEARSPMDRVGSLFGGNG